MEHSSQPSFISSYYVIQQLMNDKHKDNIAKNNLQLLNFTPSPSTFYIAQLNFNS